LQRIAHPRDDTHSSMSETTADSRAATLPIAPLLPSWRWLAAAGAVFVADLFLHLPITDACDALVRRFGFDTWDLVVRRGFLGLGVAMVAAVALWSSSQKRLMLTSAALLVAVALVFQRFLLVSGIENIHYPQYALMVSLLMRGGVRAEGAYLISTGLGAVDEAYQLATMPRGTPGYFDWNDVALNALGAAFGVVLMLAIRKTEEGQVTYRHRTSIVVGAAVLISLALWPPTWTPFFSVTPGGRVFHKLSGSEAVIVAGALWAAARYLTSGAIRQPALVNRSR
jgi:hypothetical protein